MNRKPFDCKKLCLTELTIENKQKIILGLKKELGIPEHKIDEKIIFFQISPLSLKENTEHTKGKLASYLDQVIPNCRYNIGIVYGVIFDEFKRRNNYEWNINSFEEVVKHKGISKNQFSLILDAIVKNSNSENNWSEIYNYILKENWGFMDVKKLKENYFRYETDKMNYTNEILLNLKEKIVKLISTVNNEYNSLDEFMNTVYRQYLQVKSNEGGDLFRMVHKSNDNNRTLDKLTLRNYKKLIRNLRVKNHEKIKANRNNCVFIQGEKSKKDNI